MSEPYWEPLGAAPVSKSGQEIASYISAVTSGGTGITGTGNGDALFNFPAVEFEAVLHYFEMQMLVQDNGGAAVFEIRLHDGAAPGPLVWAGLLRTATSNPGNPQVIKVPFTPSAGVHTYHVRWRDVTTGRTYNFVGGSGGWPTIARIVRA
jgi:hypothetical protein